jgi:hypothetical protein
VSNFGWNFNRNFGFKNYLTPPKNWQCKFFFTLSIYTVFTNFVTVLYWLMEINPPLRGGKLLKNWQWNWSIITSIPRDEHCHHRHTGIWHPEKSHFIRGAMHIYICTSVTVVASDVHRYLPIFVMAEAEIYHICRCFFY